MNFPSNVWFPVVTLILGAILKGVFDALTDGRAHAREREARKEQRSDAIRLERGKFQRATLLELQGAAARAARCAGRIHYEDLMASRQSGKWGVSALTDEVSESARQAQSDLQLLRVRVRDERVREFTSTFADATGAVGAARNEADAAARFDELATAFEVLQEAMGVAFRALDEDEDSFISKAETQAA